MGSGSEAPAYRLYHFNQEGRVIAAEGVCADSDSAAALLIRACVSSSYAELWCGPRLVSTYNTRPPSRSPLPGEDDTLREEQLFSAFGRT